MSTNVASTSANGGTNGPLGKRDPSRCGTSADKRPCTAVVPGPVSFILRRGRLLALRLAGLLLGELCWLVGLVLRPDPERDGGDLDLDKNLSLAS